MNFDRSPDTGGPERPTATVVTFPGPGSRRFRHLDEATRGTILLFTGIRYERMPETTAPMGPETQAARLRRHS
ncbi:hypothetical protein [Methylobacterium gossipiicola]|uniref:Uncharacterized protein n=1 Tax=Methylobacterium gossipiicola TaxID=582675 RepID=A0A1I2WTH7_9HYPH|nr:hypothetical protein [Methylobacterium gossipiicola]SFH02901.1 hypothetical protein SAMN05192565_12542 [Methylobacterium gossipiicola]